MANIWFSEVKDLQNWPVWRVGWRVYWELGQTKSLVTKTSYKCYLAASMMWEAGCSVEGVVEQTTKMEEEHLHYETKNENYSEGMHVVKNNY